MAKARFAPLTSWSFSTYAQYLKCAYSVCLDKILKIRMQEPDNPHFVKGNRAHQILDVYVSGEGKTRPSLTDKVTVLGETVKIDLRAIEPQMQTWRAAKSKRTEQEWAFDRLWNPTDWRDWKTAWVRMKLDVCTDTTEPPHVDVIDLKTGKVHEEHRLQRRLYATGGLQLVQIGTLAGGDKRADLTAQHVYVDTNITATENFKMKDLAPLKREWTARIKTMMNDTTFKPTPGWHCKWCRFRKSAGGPCPEDQ
jgi:hypothetical protein